MNSRIYKLANLRVERGILANKSKTKKPDSYAKTMRKNSPRRGATGATIEGYERELMSYANDMLGQGKWYEAQGLDEDAAFRELAETQKYTRMETDSALQRTAGDDVSRDYVKRVELQNQGLARDSLGSFYDDQEYQATEAELPMRKDILQMGRAGAGSLMSQHNQAAMRSSQISNQYGSMESNIAGGLGEAAGYIASLQYANKFQGGS